MARFADLPHGIVEQLHRQFAIRISGPEGLKLNDHPKVWDAMLAAMREQPAFRLVHGRFNPLTDKIAMVKSWPGVNPVDVDAAFEAAKADGTIALFEAESPKNELLDIVIVVYLSTLWETLLYARERMRETWGEEKYSEWAAAYAQDVDENRIKAILGAKPFIPNRIVFEVVDFGANWNPKDGTVLFEVQKTQVGQLADFAVIYEASESPKWVEQMNGTKVPYAIAAALLLSVPGSDGWSYSPDVWRSDGRAKLYGRYVDSRFYRHAMPVRREPNKL